MSLISSCRRHELHVASCSVVYDYVDVLMLTCYAKLTSPLLQPVPLTVPVLTDTRAMLLPLSRAATRFRLAAVLLMRATTPLLLQA